MAQLQTRIALVDAGVRQIHVLAVRACLICLAGCNELVIFRR